MWRSPSRPANRNITQAYEDGLVTVYAVSDGGVPGYQPVEEPEVKIVLRYEEQTVGVTRYYQAKQNDINIERLIRVPRCKVEITNQDIAVTEDGKRYRIDRVQSVENVWPKSIELTLVRLEEGEE